MTPTYRKKNLLDYLFEGFRSTLQEKWERNGKGIHEDYGQSYVNGKETGNLFTKKN